MATYVFQAKSAQGKAVKGEVEANNESEARVKIRAQKMVPIKIAPKEEAQTEEGSGSVFKDSVSVKDLKIFTRQFAVLVGAGVPIVQGLEALHQGTASTGLQKALRKILDEVERGKRLAEALATCPTVFDRMYVNLVRAGEEGGVLEEVLNRLAEYIEKTAKLRGKILGALWYPAAIILVAIAVIAGIMIFVIPSFVSMFEDAGQELPQLTQIVIAISEGFQTYWYLVIGALIGIPVSLNVYYKTEDGRRNLDSFLIETPLFGPLIQKAAVARTSRTLSTLLGAGVRIIDALEIAGQTAGNYVIERAMQRAKDGVGRGKTLAEPLQAEKHMPTMVCQMIAVGEETGNLDAMLNKVADFYEDEVENAADTLTSMIEPILMVVLGGIVAVIVIAMYLPVFKLAGAVT